jgi:flagellar biosynthetic protein FliR
LAASPIQAWVDDTQGSRATPMIQVTDTQLLAWLSAFLLPFFRVLGLMSAAPILSNRAFPVRARVAFAALIALCAAPSIAVPPAFDLASGKALAVIARETGIGLAIGFAARLALSTFELAGELIGLQMGLSFAGFFDPASGSGNAVGSTLGTLSLMSFVAMDGPIALILAVIHSFSAFPIDAVGGLPLARLSPLAMGSELFATGLSIALPFMSLLLFLNVVLGVMSRVAPQFNLFGRGFPITLGAGMLLLSTGLPMLQGPLEHTMERLSAMIAP